ncbi:MAG: recombinase RecT [Patescibacteria group bacterium]|nr:recombinase RecT [Patescibacteria group bacterium]
MDNADQTKVVIKNPDDLKLFLAKNYMNQIKNFFGNEKQAMKFLSSVMSAVQKMPKLLDCEPMSVINSFMTMAQLGLMPSDVSGEAFVLPYDSKKNGLVAQFQLGYQGLVTLFYRAGGQSVRAEIVREHDDFSYENGVIRHKIDIFKSNEDRGEPIGAYAIALVNGQEIAKAMNKKDILDMAKNFSKSFNSAYTPWKEINDPELWMWKKTVLKQLGKLMPKNETIFRAIAEDNQDGDLKKPVEGLVDSSNLKMGNFLKEKYEKDPQGEAPQADTAKGDSA